MPQFGSTSQNKLNTCHHDLQRLFSEVIKHYDCTVICGARSDADQRKAFAEGKSKADGVNDKSKHQTDKQNPFSRAVDIAPYPIDWNDTKRFYHFAGFVQATAESLGINIRWGGDWDSDNDFKDNKIINDLPHFELV